MTGMPPKYPGDLDRRRDELVKIYKAAQDRLQDQLKQVTTTDFARFRIGEQLQQIDAVVAVLNVDVDDAVKELIPGFYEHGTDLAAYALKKQGVAALERNLGNLLHTQAIQSVADQMALDLHGANASIGGTAKRILRETKQSVLSERAINKQIAASLVEGRDARTATRILSRELEDQLKGQRFVRAGSRNFTPQDYAEIVVRTRTREAVTAGTLNHGKEYGVTLYQVTVHDTSCPVCRPFQGKVFTIDPDDKRFPYLDERPPFHPRCAHNLVPLVPVPDEEGQAELDALSRLSKQDGEIVSGSTGYEEMVNAAKRTAALRSAPPPIGGFGRKKTSGLPPEKFPEIQRALGSVLKVRGYDDPGLDGEIIRRHMNDMARIDPAMWAKLRRNGLERVEIGPGSVADFDGFTELAKSRVSGYPKGVTWKDISGAYDPIRKALIAGTQGLSAENTILHEYGHALGSILGYYEDYRLKETYLRLYDKLDDFYKGAGKRGMQEFFADVVKGAIINQGNAPMRFGEEFGLFIEGIVLKGRAPKMRRKKI